MKPKAKKRCRGVQVAIKAIARDESNITWIRDCKARFRKIWHRQSRSRALWPVVSNSWYEALLPCWSSTVSNRINLSGAYPCSDWIWLTNLADIPENNLAAQSCNGWRDETAKQQFNPEVSASSKTWNVRETAHRLNLTDSILLLSCSLPRADAITQSWQILLSTEPIQPRCTNCRPLNSTFSTSRLQLVLRGSNARPSSLLWICAASFPRSSRHWCIFKLNRTMESKIGNE